MRTLSALALIALLSGCTVSPEPIVDTPDSERETRTPLMQLNVAGGAISGSVDIASLDGACEAFDTLRIDGDLFATDLDSTALPDVSCLQVVTGDVVISGNTELLSLQPLVGLRTVGGDIVVQDNPELLDLLGLDRLTRARSITIAGNDSLLDLEGLDSLTDVTDHLTVADNEGIQSLEGLLSLAPDWNGDIVVVGNSDLRDLSGLDALTSLRGTLEVAQNPVLSSLAGADALRHVGDTLRIHGNDALTDITALASVETIGGDLLVTDNPRLSGEAVDELMQSIDEVDGSIIVTGNGA